MGKGGAETAKSERGEAGRSGREESPGHTLPCWDPGPGGNAYLQPPPHPHMAAPEAFLLVYWGDIG